MMLEKIAIIFLALSALSLFLMCKNLDKSINNLQDAYISVSRAYEEQEKRMEKLKESLRVILKDINSR